MANVKALALRVYHQLPPVVQNLAASVHGGRLMRQRYGDHFRAELAAYQQREAFTAEQWHEWQSHALQRLLWRAVERVPYYRRLYAAGQFPIEEVRGPEDIARLPRLPKDVVRANYLELLADDCRPEEMVHEHTSGTTGKPVDLLWSRNTCQSWYACFERRVRNWSGVQLGDRWAMLGGQLVVPQQRRRPPFWVWNAPGAQLYMSSYHLSPEFIPYYLDEIKRRKIDYLYGYASSLDALATFALQAGRDDVRVKVAFSNAEPFYRYQRERIEQAFGCITRDTYAPAELCIAAFEDDRGQLRLSPDVGITEVLRADGTPADFEEPGELVVTGLLNTDHILIRYEQGDRGTVASPAAIVGDPLQMPILRSIEGRMDDVLVTPDGRKIGRLDPVFKATLRIREAQIIQHTIDQLTVRVVPVTGYDETDAETIRNGLRQRMGEVQVQIQLVDEIPRTKAGKFRAVVNAMNEQPPSSSEVAR